MTEDREGPVPPGERVGPASGKSRPESRDAGTRPTPVFGRGALVALLVWGLAVLAVSAGIAGATNFWWVVPLVGAAVPIALVLAQNRTPRDREGLAETKERELLDALRELSELTPTTAAMLTTATVSEASEILENLARAGHLEAQAREGRLVYALREGDRRGLAPAARPESGTDALPAQASSPRQPDEPLSEREIEVLKLIASGRTN
ncbi:MAG: hypothetical protein ACRDTR_17635, partial [Rubrobacter sp.]